MMAYMLLLEVARRCPESRKKINNIVEVFSLWMLFADAKRPGEGGRLNAAISGQGGREGQKLAKSCGNLLCMTPYLINYY